MMSGRQRQQQRRQACRVHAGQERGGGRIQEEERSRERSQHVQSSRGALSCHVPDIADAEESGDAGVAWGGARRRSPEQPQSRARSGLAGSWVPTLHPDTAGP